MGRRGKKRDVTRYKRAIELAIRNYARYRSDDEKDELRQECYVALLKPRKGRITPRRAYRIARSTIIWELRKLRRRVDDPILEPATQGLLPYDRVAWPSGIRTKWAGIRKVQPARFQRWSFDEGLGGSSETEPSHEELLDEIIDAKAAIERLPWPEDEILKMYFGVGVPKRTVREIASEMEMSRMEVWRVKQKALEEVRKILGVTDAG